jgi:hypothetical protein
MYSVKKMGHSVGRSNLVKGATTTKMKVCGARAAAQFVRLLVVVVMVVVRVVLLLPLSRARLPHR